MVQHHKAFEIVPLNQRWQQKQKRTCAPCITYAQKHFQRLWIVDASILEALIRKPKSWETKRFIHSTSAPHL